MHLQWKSLYNNEIEKWSDEATALIASWGDVCVQYSSKVSDAAWYIFLFVDFSPCKIVCDEKNYEINPAEHNNKLSFIYLMINYGFFAIK